MAAEEEIAAAPELVADVAIEPTPVGHVATVTGEVAVQCEDVAH